MAALRLLAAQRVEGTPVVGPGTTLTPVVLGEYAEEFLRGFESLLKRRRDARGRLLEQSLYGLFDVQREPVLVSRV